MICISLNIKHSSRNTWLAALLLNKHTYTQTYSSPSTHCTRFKEISSLIHYNPPTHTSLPLLPIFIIRLHTAVHNPAGGSVEHHTVSIHTVSAQPGHGAMFPHIVPCLHVLLHLTP